MTTNQKIDSAIAMLFALKDEITEGQAFDLHELTKELR